MESTLPVRVLYNAVKCSTVLHCTVRALWKGKYRVHLWTMPEWRCCCATMRKDFRTNVAQYIIIIFHEPSIIDEVASLSSQRIHNLLQLRPQKKRRWCHKATAARVSTVNALFAILTQPSKRCEKFTQQFWRTSIRWFRGNALPSHPHTPKKNVVAYTHPARGVGWSRAI